MKQLAKKEKQSSHQETPILILNWAEPWKIMWSQQTSGLTSGQDTVSGLTYTGHRKCSLCLEY